MCTQQLVGFGIVRGEHRRRREVDAAERDRDADINAAIPNNVCSTPLMAALLPGNQVNRSRDSGKVDQIVRTLVRLWRGGRLLEWTAAARMMRLLTGSDRRRSFWRDMVVARVAGVLRRD